MLTCLRPVVLVACLSFCSLRLHACMRSINSAKQESYHFAKRTLILPIQRRATDGRSFSPKSYVDITGKTIASTPASCDSITCTDHSERTRAAKRKRRQRSREK